MDDVVDGHTNNVAATRSNYRSSVDTSRPFSSVKEAVAIFGERLLVRDIYHSPSAAAPHMKANSPSRKSASPSPSPSASASPSVIIDNRNSVKWHSLELKIEPEPSDSAAIINERDLNDIVLLESVRRLEAELEETKAALKQLKKQGSETEIALASLNAELHLNMAKMARAEAAAAKKAADRGKDEAAGEDKLIKMSMVSSPTLAQILNLGSEMSTNGYYSNKKTKVKKKKKPVVPLIGDFLYWKKKDSRSALNDNPLYGSPNVF